DFGRGVLSGSRDRNFLRDFPCQLAEGFCDFAPRLPHNDRSAFVPALADGRYDRKLRQKIRAELAREHLPAFGTEEEVPLLAAIAFEIAHVLDKTKNWHADF